MESAFLKQLSDFTSLKHRQGELASSREDFDPEVDFNDRLLRSFRELKDKLKLAHRQSQGLRDELKTLQVQLIQAQQLEQNQRTIGCQLRQALKQSQNGSEELRLSLSLAKEQIRDKQELEQEVSFLKQALAQTSSKAEGLEREKKQLLVVQVEEKLALERELERLQVQNHSQQESVQQGHQQLASLKEQLLKAHNQLKKLEIQHEELLFTQQWANDNFQAEAHQQQLSRLTEQVSSLTSKLKQEKQRRHQLQERVLELEHTAGLTHLQAETYQGETTLLSQKVKGIQKQVSKTKSKLERTTKQNLDWQTRFSTAVQVGEELIGRVKRELNGELVELARSCQFRLNKLKSKDRKQNPSKENRNPPKEVGFRESRTKSKHSFPASIKEQQSHLPSSLPGTEELPAPDQSRRTEGDKVEEKNRTGQLQGKIRREREQMEKKLREKALFRKMEVAGSPLKASLRQNYLQMIFH